MFPQIYGVLSQGGALPDYTDNLIVWLDETGHNFPTGWSDNSANGNDANVIDLPPVVDAGKINGLDAVEFDYAINDYLQTAAFSSELTQPNTIFIVGYTGGTGSTSIITDGISSTKRHLTAYIGVSDKIRVQSSTILDIPATWDTPNLLTAVFNNTASKLYQDGTLIGEGTTGAQGLTGLTIANNFASSNYFGGWIGEIRVYNEELSETNRAIVANYLGQKWGITMPSALSIDSIPDYATIQRDGSNQADLVVSGTYLSTTTIPTAIEYNIGAGWITLDASPANGQYNGTISNVTGGQYTLQVRFANDTSITAASNYVGVGDVFIIAGQSNASGRGANNQAYSHATLKAALFSNAYEWGDLLDPTDTNPTTDTVSEDDSAAGSFWPLLATEIMADQGVPVAFIPCATGGTSIQTWQKVDGEFARNRVYGSMQYRGFIQSGGVKAVLWWQGERDAVVGTLEATYNTKLDALASDIATDLGCSLMACKIEDLSAYSPGYDETAVNNAIGTAWADNANVLQGPDFSDITPSVDGVHFVTDGELATAASRWWTAIQAAFY